MAKFGETDWSEEPRGGKSASAKDLFLKLPPGENDIRFVSKPYQYLIHNYKLESDTGYGTRIKCTGESSCPLCLAGNKAKTRWYILTIDRRSSRAKILDLGYALYAQIRTLANNQRWGNPSGYDMTITVNPKGGATNYYTAMPIEKSPLSAEDQKLVDDFDLEEIARRCLPLSVEQVQKAVERYEEELANPQGAPQQVQRPKAAAQPVAQAKPAVVKAPVFDDDDDDDFPSAF